MGLGWGAGEEGSKESLPEREIKKERHCSGAKAFKVKGKVPRQKEA